MTSRALTVRHQRAFVVAACCFTALALLISPTMPMQILALAPLVAILGVPHGALDLRLAQSLWPIDGLFGLAAFGVAYIGLAAIVVLVWLSAPSAGLCAFLAYSAWHFSDDWRGELNPIARGLAGVSVIALPAVLGRDEVRLVFEQLATPASAEALAGILHGLGLLCLVGLVAIAVRSWLRRRRLAFELAALVALALAAPPLVYFIVYFCGLHSPRHFLESIRALNLDVATGLTAAAPLTLTTIGFALVAALAMFELGLSVETTTLKTVFIGLAALTVPHMLLVDRFWRR